SRHPDPVPERWNGGGQGEAWAFGNPPEERARFRGPGPSAEGVDRPEGPRHQEPESKRDDTAPPKPIRVRGKEKRQRPENTQGHEVEDPLHGDRSEDGRGSKPLGAREHIDADQFADPGGERVDREEADHGRAEEPPDRRTTMRREDLAPPERPEPIADEGQDAGREEPRRARRSQAARGVRGVDRPEERDDG